MSDASKIKTAINTAIKGANIELASEVDVIRRVKTGLLSLDEQTGGGLPMGVPISVQGRKSVGKSAFCYYVIGEAIKQYGGVPFIIQAEKGFDPEWAEACGLPIKDCLLYEATRLDNALQLTLKVMREYNPTCVLLDSISMLDRDPEHSIVDSESHGGRAKPSNAFFRKLTEALTSEAPPLFLYIEHLHPIIGKPGLQTTGGETKGYANVMELRMSLDTPVLDEFASYSADKEKVKLPVQARVNWEIRKSKVSPARGVGTYTLGLREMPYCKKGQIDDYDELIVRGILSDHIIKAGTWLTIVETKEKYQGVQKLRLGVEPVTLKEIILRPRPDAGKVNSQIKGSKAAAPKRSGGGKGRLRGGDGGGSGIVPRGTQDGDGEAVDDKTGVAGEDHEGSGE